MVGKPGVTNGRTPVWVRVLLFVLTGVTCAFIFSNSTDTGEQSGAESLRVTEAVARAFVKDYQELPQVEQEVALTRLHQLVRKTAHFLEYALLGFLGMLSVLCFDTWFCPSFRPCSRGIRYPGVWLACVLYAVGDEVYQLFVDGRAGRPLDVLIDSAGALFGGLLALLIGFLIARGWKRRYIAADG